MCNGLVMIRGLTRSEGEVLPPPKVLKINMRPYLTTTTTKILIQPRVINLKD